MRDPALRQPSGARSSRRGAFERGLVLALVLHATGLTLTALIAPLADEPPRARLPLSDPTPVALEFELEQEQHPERGQSSAMAAAQSGQPSATAAASVPESLAALSRPRAAPSRGSGAPIAAGASSAVSAVDDFQAAFDPEPGATLGAQQGADEGTGADATEKAAASPHAADAAPRLSLEQLGVGAGHNPFLGPSSSPAPSARQALGRQIDHVLRSGLAEHDRELGLGPEGPAVALVTELVMQSESAPNTSALLGLRTDADGYTVHVEVREASGDTRAWEAVAAELQRKLAGQRLRVPTGSGGVSMELRVTSRNQLPSGADPGLAIELFGQEIKSGDGKRSARLQILTPKISVQEVEMPYGDGRQKVQALNVSLALVAFMGDPVDIGAVARRVVHAHLVSMETHPRDIDTAPSLH